MTIKKTTVSAAVNSAVKATKAESVSTNAQDWDKLLINSNEAAPTDNPSKKYFHYMGKDRLLREAPGWGSASNMIVQFVIFGTDEEGNQLPDLPKTRFGSLADVIYCEKQYPMSKGYYVSDQVCRNGRHKIDIYKIHITGVLPKPEKVEVE